MTFLIFSFIAFLAASAASFFSADEKTRKFFACGGVVLGSLLGMIPAVGVLAGGLGAPTVLEGAWESAIPGLVLSFGIDRLSAVFLVAILFLSLLTAIYSWSYLKNQARALAVFPFFPILVGAMEAVVTARDGFLFLILWEVMSLASFFLVTAEHEGGKVRQAGWIYLIATHLATAFLMIFFILLSGKTSTFLFRDFVAAASSAAFSTTSSFPALGSLLFFCALIGFGTKAGIFPFHIWLPHAHPAAPSPVSALMSGVMIKTGIYGLLRAFTFLGPPPIAWGEILLGLGILSAVLGVLYALMQHDLKRLLAYHSVENIGIITVGIGLGLIGTTLNQPLLKILGFGGALYHVWNHAVFKGLLFLGAGSVMHATRTRAIDKMGGLLKKMPVTGTTFLIAAAAICGLPPLNGFVSEWLIYIGLFHASQTLTHLPLFLVVAGIVGIAFAGGLAIACFTKVFGVVFLGEPRSRISNEIHEAEVSMRWPMVILAALCLALGLGAPWILPLFVELEAVPAAAIIASLNSVSLAFAAIVVFTAALFFVWRRWRQTKPARENVTWDCGYAHPSPRMQYTASSFAEPIGTFFRALLKPATHFKKAGGFFPAAENFEEHVHDLPERRWFAPLFEKIGVAFAFIRRKQRSRIQDYLMLIFSTLVALLLWELW